MDGKEGWIVTYSGKKFYPLDPDPESICISDIAHALSNICRFTGHTREFYSVAQHSYLVSLMANNFPLEALLHDASEAYLCDIASPVKYSPEFSRYRDAENHLQGVIYNAFGVNVVGGHKHEEVREADHLMTFLEGVAFMPKFNGALWDCEDALANRYCLEAWSPRYAEERFINRFHSLYQGEKWQRAK